MPKTPRTARLELHAARCARTKMSVRRITQSSARMIPANPHTAPIQNNFPNACLPGKPNNFHGRCSTRANTIAGIIAASRIAEFLQQHRPQAARAEIFRPRQIHSQFLQRIKHRHIKSKSPTRPQPFRTKKQRVSVRRLSRDSKLGTGRCGRDIRRRSSFRFGVELSHCRTFPANRLRHGKTLGSTLCVHISRANASDVRNFLPDCCCFAFWRRPYGWCIPSCRAAHEPDGSEAVRIGEGWKQWHGRGIAAAPLLDAASLLRTHFTAINPASIPSILRCSTLLRRPRC